MIYSTGYRCSSSCIFKKSCTRVTIFSSTCRWCQNSVSNKKSFYFVSHSYYVHTRVEKSVTTEIVCHSETDLGTNLVSQTASSSKPQSLQATAPLPAAIKHYGHRMRLYCRTGYCIAILPDGTVIGENDGNHPSGKKSP